MPAKKPFVILPNFLYGTTAEVNRSWRSIKKTIWSDELWPSLSDDMINRLYPESNYLIIAANNGEKKYNTRQYLTYMIVENPFVEFSVLRSNWQKHACLTWSGMDQFWFSLCISSNAFNGCEFIGDIDQGKEFTFRGISYQGKSFYRYWLTLYLQWLEDFLFIWDKTYSNYDARSTIVSTRVNFMTIWHTAIKAGICDYRDDLINLTPFPIMVDRALKDNVFKYSNSIFTIA